MFPFTSLDIIERYLLVDVFLVEFGIWLLLCLVCASVRNRTAFFSEDQAEAASFLVFVLEPFITDKVTVATIVFFPRPREVIVPVISG